jgi:hypothetical protein
MAAKKSYYEEMKRIQSEAEAMPRVPISYIFDFQTKLRDKFDGFFAGRYWKHERPPEVKWLLARGVRPADGHFNAESFENPIMQLQLPERLMLIAGEAVAAERDKFSVCARCGKPFMAEKNPRRKHCSETCSLVLRVRRYRAKNNKSRLNT